MNRRNFIKNLLISGAIINPETITYSLFQPKKDWKKFVSYQPMPEYADSGLIFYLKTRSVSSINGVQNKQVSIDNKPVSVENAIYTEDTILEGLKETFNKFPCEKVKITWNEKLEEDSKLIRGVNIKEELTRIVSRETNLSLNKLKSKVAKNCLRGFPNMQFEDTYFYRGKTDFDSPVIVYSFGDRYGIETVSNFKDYGFII